jgi:hypothetical protein
MVYKMVRATLDDEEMFKHALDLIETAEKQGVYLRLLGAMAIRMHIQDTEFMELYDALSRLGLDADRKFTDIDFIAYKKQLKGVRNVFEKELDFKVDRMMLQYLRDRGRLIYYAPDNAYHVDVFFDKLEFSHDVHFGKDPKKGRLHLDSPTIPLADIVLQKTQIHRINEKDIKDIIILLRAHDLIDTDKTDETNLVNIEYIAQVLADDWGFWKDATDNLQKVKSFCEKYWKEELISQDDMADVLNKVNTILGAIEDEPKTKDWKKRAKKGESKQWWRNVEEVER